MEMIHGGRGFCKSERRKKRKREEKREATGFAVASLFERIFAVVGVLFVGSNLTDEGLDCYNGLISNLKINV